MKAGRRGMAYVLLGILLISQIGILFLNSGIVEGLQNRADRLKTYAIAECKDRMILPGDIYDRNGNLIAGTDFVTSEVEDEDGETLEVTNRVTSYSDGMAYSQLVGYTGRRLFSPQAETIEEVIGERNDARLMQFLDEDYWGENGLYTTTNIDGTKGQSAVLTIDNELQMKVYELLCEQMSATDEIGSAIVMNAKTGEILADVCFPTYDFNDLANAQEEMADDAEETNLEPGYPITYKNSITPGSVFKMFMAVALIDHGMGDFTVENKTFEVNDTWTCKATTFASNTLVVQEGDMLDLETALNISSNVYFAKAALELGADGIRETAEKFMMSEEDTKILTDFGNLKYNWDLDVSEDVLAQTGFGQGKTEWSTIFGAMLTQAIANDGVMMKPYMVKELQDANGHTVYKGEAEVLSEATSKETASTVASYMESTATEVCRVYGMTDIEETFSKYRVAGKTGTAENGDEEATDNAWYISFAPANNPEYVVVVNQCRAHKFGYNMMPTVAGIYEYLFEEYK